MRESSDSQTGVFTEYSPERRERIDYAINKMAQVMKRWDDFAAQRRIPFEVELGKR